MEKKTDYRIPDNLKLVGIGLVVVSYLTKTVQFTWFASLMAFSI